MTIPKRTGDLYAPGENAYKPNSKHQQPDVDDNARNHVGLWGRP